jgi:hypothetical protein
MQVESRMTPRPSQIPRQLRAREVLDIRDGQGLAVRCLAGALWITQDGDTDDIVLKAGQCFVLDRPGLALVSAPVAPATVVIEAAARDAPCLGPKVPATDRLRLAA